MEEREYFWLRSGGRISSINELASAVPTLSEEDFSHHVERVNDFACWVRNVFREEQLADRLENCQSREDLQTVLFNHIMHHWIADRKPREVPPSSYVPAGRAMHQWRY